LGCGGILGGKQESAGGSGHQELGPAILSSKRHRQGFGCAKTISRLTVPCQSYLPVQASRLLGEDCFGALPELNSLATAIYANRGFHPLLVTIGFLAAVLLSNIYLSSVEP